MLILNNETLVQLDLPEQHIYLSIFLIQFSLKHKQKCILLTLTKTRLVIN